MARVRIGNLGGGGFIGDLQPYELAPEQFSSVRNMRFNETGMCRMLGEVRYFGTDSAPMTVQPYWLFRAKTPTEDVWVGAGQQKVYAIGPGATWTQTNITRQSAGVDVNYAATEAAKWNGAMFQGFLVINNGVDEPQFWAPNIATNLANLSSAAGSSPWDATHRAAVIAPFKNYLVAIDITKGSTRNPYLVKWSHIADPAALPTSWDETDPTVDAGEFPLTDTPGILVGALAQREHMIIYAEDGFYQMQRTGNEFIMGFDRVAGSRGLISPQGVTVVPALKNDTHFVFGVDDLFVHNGQEVTSIVDGRNRRWLFNQIDADYYKRSFVVVNPQFNEVWACFPQVGSEQPTLALIWNTKTGAVGFRDLLQGNTGLSVRNSISTRGTPCIAVGTVTNVTSEPWSSDSGSWESDTTAWDQNISNPTIERLFMVDRASTKHIYLLDSSHQFVGTDFESYAVRTGLAVFAQDHNGQPKSDLSISKLVHELWPMMTAAATGTMQVQFGMQDRTTDPITWLTAKDFDFASDVKVDDYVNAKLFSVGFFFSAASALVMTGYELEVTRRGK